MKRLLLVALLFSFNIAHAGYLTVTGMGRTFEEAKQQAFRNAIEFTVGANVLSDIETRNYKRIKDEIYVYSSGYIDDYKIIKQEIKNNIVYLTVDVVVSENKLKNRIISVGKSNKTFDSDRHSVQISSYLNERNSAGKLLAKHLETYPERAYTIQQLTYSISIDERRNPVLNIPYILTWNYEYVKTLRETLETIQDVKDNLFAKSASAIVIMAKNPKDWILGEKTVHRFNDLNIVNQLHETLNGPSEVRIIIRLKDMFDEDITSACYVPNFIHGSSGFYGIGEMRVKQIFGNTKEESIIKLPINSNIVNNIKKIELTIASNFDCKNYKYK